MSRTRTLIVSLAALAGGVLAAPASPAAAAAPPAPTVALASATGTIGRFDSSVIVSVRQRCAAGLSSPSLTVTARQGDVAGTRTAPYGARCDGAWHTVRAEVPSSTGDEFVPGTAEVTVRLRASDPAGKTYSSALVRGSVTLLPQVELVLGTEGSVGQLETVRIPVRYRCDSPWIVSGFNLNVTQGTLFGEYFTDQGFRCDNGWHHKTIVMRSSTGEPFESGHAEVRASLDIQDPVDFDPVGQASTVDDLWIAPAARAVLQKAALNSDGSVTVTMKARCQRPWIVQDWGASIAQDEGRTFGFAARSTGLVCDQTWKTLTIRVVGSSPYVRGPAEVSVSVSVLDPENYDPVGAGGETRTVELS